MKVQSTKAQGFTPITTSITFETQEEFETFGALMSLDATLPQAAAQRYTLYSGAEINKTLAGFMLRSISYSLEEHNS